MMSKRPHGIACPHCGSATSTRYSRALTATYRQLQLQCSNAECGATYGAELAITHEISPPAVRNAAVTLRRSPPRKRAANDDFPPAAPVSPDLSSPSNDPGERRLATG